MIQLKNDEQIDGIRKSCKLLGALHEDLRGYVKVGMTTKQIDDHCYTFIKDHKGKPAFLGYMGFPGTACLSVNEEIIHGIPGSRIVNHGDLLSIDLGIDLGGYFSDAAQSIIVGEGTTQLQKLNRVTKECLYQAISQVKPGNRISNISKAVFSHATKNGYGVVKEYCGHGVGLSQHEEPQIPNYVSIGPNPRLKPGMILAIEPMINMGSRHIKHLNDGWTVITRDGKPSSHWEHTVLVTEDGVEILTAL